MPDLLLSLTNSVFGEASWVVVYGRFFFVLFDPVFVNAFVDESVGLELDSIANVSEVEVRQLKFFKILLYPLDVLTTREQPLV